MRILVTGGAGYIGSHTAKALARGGHEPVVVDDLRTGHRENVRWGPLVEASLSDIERVRQVIRSEGIEAVVHFAASAYVGESMRHPRAYFHNNVGGTLALLDAMLDEGVRSIVFSSSCATYGIPERVPINESQAQAPVNPYGESKLFVERALDWYGQAYGLRWAALRYFNAAGADPDGDLGEDHDPETHLIPLAVHAALRVGPPLEIFGTDYRTSDGTAVRDFIHVTDLANAHVRALRLLASGQTLGGINLGTGRGHSVREVIAAVERAGQRPVPVREVARRPGDPPALVADPAAAMRRLDWQPEFASIDSIVATAFQWHATRAAGDSRSGPPVTGTRSKGSVRSPTRER